MLRINPTQWSGVGRGGVGADSERGMCCLMRNWPLHFFQGAGSLASNGETWLTSGSPEGSKESGDSRFPTASPHILHLQLRVLFFPKQVLGPVLAQLLRPRIQLSLVILMFYPEPGAHLFCSSASGHESLFAKGPSSSYLQTLTAEQSLSVFPKNLLHLAITFNCIVIIISISSMFIGHLIP